MITRQSHTQSPAQPKHEFSRGCYHNTIAQNRWLFGIWLLILSMHGSITLAVNITPNGNIGAAAYGPDGTLYIGGGFTSIGGVSRNHLAAIKPDLTLSDWNPGANDHINALAVSGDTVYIGGNFTQVSGTGRDYLAAVGTDGNLKSWNPGAGSSVLALAVNDATVYVGGLFTTLGGQSRNYLAAVGIDGSLSAWDPSLENSVNVLAISEGKLFVGGGIYCCWRHHSRSMRI